MIAVNVIGMNLSRFGGIQALKDLSSRMLKKAVLRSPVFSRHFLSKSESDPQKPPVGSSNPKPAFLELRTQFSSWLCGLNFER
jgi:hypothetical protein